MILDSVTEATLTAVVELLYTGRCHLTQVTAWGHLVIEQLKLSRHPEVMFPLWLWLCSLRDLVPGSL